MSGDGPSAAATAIREGVQQVGKGPLFPPGSTAAQSFKLEKPEICDVILKGGVTSGIVYPYAMLRLAQKFRLVGIGGTSAGAMAAALTAAAEYSRQAHGDHESFARFEEQCLPLPRILPNLFQPHEKHRTVFAFIMAVMAATDSSLEPRQRRAGMRQLLVGRPAILTWFVLGLATASGAFAAARYIRYYGWEQGLVSAGAGLLSGVLLLGLFLMALRWTSLVPIAAYLVIVAAAAAASIWAELRSPLGVLLPSTIGGALGLAAALALIVNHLVGNLRETDFGLCSGLKRPDAKHAGVTDWLHDAIQKVANLPADQPLTFGDVRKAVKGRRAPKIALRMITTNMTLRRPYALPDLSGPEGPIGWIPDEWKPLFPRSVIRYLRDCDPKTARLADDKPRPLPDGDRLPVIVAARMSLSFPVLFCAVPVHLLTPGGRSSRERMRLVDGGLSSNLPLHFFDNLGPPSHPTFAFNLDHDPKLDPTPRPRVGERITAALRALRRQGPSIWSRPVAAWRALFPERAPEKPPMPEGLRITLHRPDSELPTLSGVQTPMFTDYLNGLLGAAKDWQEKLVSIMPGQFDRIVGIRLAKIDGGLNLQMPVARSHMLMRLGYRAGVELCVTFDLNAHRVRRALAAYQEIETAVEAFNRSWSKTRLHRELRRAKAPADSPIWTEKRNIIVDRFAELVAWGKLLNPPARCEGFPRPRGSLRITPNLSGDLLD